jgi:hypothetical protein
MKFRLEIHLGNDGMQTLADVARSFADAVNRFSGNMDALKEGDGMRVQDINGNTVGGWTVQEDHQ